jgi:hypothetical protein
MTSRCERIFPSAGFATFVAFFVAGLATLGFLDSNVIAFNSNVLWELQRSPVVLLFLQL